MIDDFCEAGRRATFGGRWKIPCMEHSHHAIANPSLEPIALCDRHFNEVNAAGLVADLNIGFPEFYRREERRVRGA